MRISLNKEEPIILIRVELIGEVGWYEIEMALDTGSTYTIIPWGVAERLGYDPATSVERVALTTASTIEKAPLITLKSMRIDDIEIDNVKVVVHDLPPKSRIDGLLGLSFLKHFNTDIHFKRKTLEIKDS
jgi:clan AA aspartic protease (TIGR02281 family)